MFISMQKNNSNIITNQQIQAALEKYLNANAGKNITCLDVGGGEYVAKKYKMLKGKTDYYILDIKSPENKKNTKYIVGDICECKEVLDNTYDITMCVNVLEHTKYPWLAISEIVRITKNGGLIIIEAPFSWNYHNHPIDFWRFSYDCLRFLIEKESSSKCILNGFVETAWTDKKQNLKNHCISSVYIGFKNGKKNI